MASKQTSLPLGSFLCPTAKQWVNVHPSTLLFILYCWASLALHCNCLFTCLSPSADYAFCEGNNHTVMGWTLPPQRFICWSPNHPPPVPPNVTIFGGWVFKKIIKLKPGHEGGPVCLVSLLEEEICTQTYTEGRWCEDTGKRYCLQATERGLE